MDITAGWFDYDNDGQLDLFVNSYLQYSIAMRRHAKFRNCPPTARQQL